MSATRPTEPFLARLAAWPAAFLKARLVSLFAAERGQAEAQAQAHAQSETQARIEAVKAVLQRLEANEATLQRLEARDAARAIEAANAANRADVQDARLTALEERMAAVASTAGAWDSALAALAARVHALEILADRGPLSLPDALRIATAPEGARWARVGEAPPRAAWSSYDRRPWTHPWLTRAHLAAWRASGEAALAMLEGRADALETAREAPPRFAFVGNMANYNETRAAPLRRRGVTVDLFPHPSDAFVMSDPGWEAFDGDLSQIGTTALTAETLALLPASPFTRRTAMDPNWVLRPLEAEAPFLRPGDVVRHPAFISYVPMLQALQDYDALLVTQAPYLAYLSGRPYAIAVTGGEIWFDTARDDAFGRLQLAAFKGAAAVLVSNPITLAHARRYGLTNLVPMPWMLDEDAYAPASPHLQSAVREDWRARSGGDFFVMMSARLDNAWKGSRIALEGFAAFARTQPGARLVLMRWGVDEEVERARLAELGIADRVIALPLAGKRRLVDCLRAADVLIEQFVLGNYGGSALEAMACGTPVVMRLEHEQYEGLWGEAPPVLEAADPEGVAARLTELAAEGEASRRGEAARAWFLRRHGGGAHWRSHLDLLAAIAEGWRADEIASPLNAPLGADESAHHARGLAEAPAFPAYEI